MNIVRFINYWQVERFIASVMEKHGHLPESLSDLEIGYFMSQAFIDCTPANKMILDLVLQNPTVFFTEEEDKEEVDHNLAKDLAAKLAKEIEQRNMEEDKTAGVVMRSWELKL